MWNFFLWLDVPPANHFEDTLQATTLEVELREHGRACGSGLNKCPSPTAASRDWLQLTHNHDRKVVEIMDG